MKNYINVIIVTLLISFISHQPNHLNNLSEWSRIDHTPVKIFIGYQFSKVSKSTKIKLLVRKGNLEVQDLGVYKGVFKSKKPITEKDNISQEFQISSDSTVNSFKFFRKSDSIILIKTSKDLINHTVNTNILSTISIENSKVLILDPVELKENPKAL